MSTDTGRPAAEARSNVHDEVLAVLPWRINGSLGEAEAARVDEHLRTCGECRRELEIEQYLYESIRGEVSTVDHAPQGSFEKLWSRIEEVERDIPPATTATGPSLALNDRNDRTAASSASIGPRRWLLAASLILAFGAGLIAGSLRDPVPSGLVPGSRSAATTLPATPAPPTASPEYRTASRAMPTAASEPAVRVVFDPSTTVEELTRILRETGLAIVAGPSESGVCTLALDRDRVGSIESALARLRADPRVRFAEPVPGDSVATGR